MAFDPKNISVSNNQTIFKSTTHISLGRNIIRFQSDGDPWPARAGLEWDFNFGRTFGSNPNSIQKQDYDFNFIYRAGQNTQNPQESTFGIHSIFVNGVVGTAPSADAGIPGSNSRPPRGFSYDAVYFGEYFGVDLGGGHPQEQGSYHYHSSNLIKGMDLERFWLSNDYFKNTNYQEDHLRHPDGHSKILGFCFDGYPIYGPYGYDAPLDNESLIKNLRSGYALLPTDKHRPDKFKYKNTITIDGVDVELAAGSFIEDYTYRKSKGDLDEHNGRFCVTPEFPQGTYAYFLTFADSELTTPEYPYIIGNTTKQSMDIQEPVDIGDTFTKPSLWSLPTGTKISNLVERRNVSIRLPIANFVGSNITVELISGNLPAGCRLEGIYIVGTTYEVERDTVSKFTLRAQVGDNIEDRTYEIVVAGPDAPEWVTNEGLLPVGANNRLYILDNQLIDYSLLATDTDLTAGDELEYFIAEGDGDLPPGITLSSDGRLQGIVEPLLALDQFVERGGYDQSPYGDLPLDFAQLPNNGFSSFFYDSEPYGYSQPTNQVKKLNRYYPFVVTVTDGDTFAKREFRIYLVGDDYLKADNTLMQTGTGVFTADATNVRTPEWLTPRNLGFLRADNYTLIPLQTIENDQLEGTVRYTLEQINDDGTKSVLPKGLSLDYYTGTLYGYLPYQPAIVKDNKFTVRATRLTFDLETVEVFGTYYEDVLLGKNSFKIYKTDLTGLEDGINDLLALRGREILLGDRTYKVINVDDSNTEYDVIFLDDTLAPEISLNLSQKGNIGNNYIFVNRLNEKQKEKYKSRTLSFSDSEKYRINSITPFIEYDVIQTTPANDPIFPYGAPENIAIGENYFVGDYVVYSDNLGGNNFIYICTEAHATTAQLNENNEFVLDNNGNQQIVFQEDKWTQVAENLESMTEQQQLLAVKQAIQAKYGSPVYITVKEQNIWNIKLPSTSTTRIKQNISQFFKGTDSASFRIDLIRDNEDRIGLSSNLKSTLNTGRNIGIALFKNDFFSKNLIISARDAVDVPSSTKTFELKTIGEVESAITWLTPSNLGTIIANLQSTLSIKAESTVPDTKMVYVITSGKLPNGMSLTYDGELIGAPRQFTNNDGLGLTYFNSGATWDGNFPGDTTFDREFKFTVEARDRFNYSAISQEFTLKIADNDNTQYTKIYMRPMLSTDERYYLQSFTSDFSIFEENKLYRPQDTEFGVQKDLKLLVYSGIESKDIKEFVSAAAKNHKRKKYNLGPIKSAIAKLSGSNEIVYEVVYIPVLDPANPTVGTTRNNFTIQTQNKITVDSIQYNTADDVTRTGAGDDVIPVYGRATVKFVNVEADTLTVDLRNLPDVQINVDDQDFEIVIKNEQNVTVTLQASDAEPYKILPDPINTLKVDSDSVKVSQSKDNIRYISNFDNMRRNISSIGESNRSYLPLWMRTPQQGLQELDYVPAIPLCYCKPGYADDIIRNLNAASFDPTQINYDIDRYIVVSARDKTDETFIIFANYQFNV